MKKIASKQSVFKIKFVNIVLLPINYILSKRNIKIIKLLKEIILSFKARLIYLIEDYDWSIKWDGTYITENLKKYNLLDAEITTFTFLKNRIIHWGSINTLIIDNKVRYINPNNYNVLTWFHIVLNDPRIKFIPYLNKKIDIIHTSNNITKNLLIKYGFNENKLVVIPLGIDLNHFNRYNNDIRIKLRDKYNIPKDKFIIGSFVKDGKGWGEGNIPKWEKGADIFCKVISKLNKKYDIHVFLTGPARGYVKNQLKKNNIPFTHVFLKNYFDIVECYNILDLYLITSRAEGGPKGALEAMACGVPLISTKVGMIPEIIIDGENGFLANIDDVNNLIDLCSKLIENKSLRDKFIKNGLKTVKKFSWDIIAKKYYEKIYKRFIKE
ncbi:MAG: glycosyltransferase family 4 protein [Promethearchaeia archaeon]